MSSFFGAPGTGSGTGAKGSPSSSSGTTGGGWGSFLKQGLSTIESKLDMVLDMQVPIPGGSSGTLTSLSPHATVLPSSVSGSGSPNSSQPKKMAPPQIPGAGAADSRASTDSRGEDGDKRASSSTTRSSVRGKEGTQDSGVVDPTRKGIVKEDDLVTVDPITGMITTSPGIKRMSTPPTSAANSAAAAAAAANRERLEQRMRGIFKKPAEPATSTSPSPSPSVTASPPSSTRPSTMLEREDKPQDQPSSNAKEEEEKKEYAEKEVEDTPEEEKEEKAVAKESPSLDTSSDAQERHEEQEEQVKADPVSENSTSAVVAEEAATVRSAASDDQDHSVVNAENPISGPETAAASGETAQPKDSDTEQLETPDALALKKVDGAVSSKTDSGDDGDLHKGEEEPSARAALDQEDSAGTAEKESDTANPTTEEVESAKSPISNDTQLGTSLTTPSTDHSYTPTSSEQTTPKDPAVAADAAKIAGNALKVENKPTKTGSGANSEAATLTDNPLKRVVEQREEQLFKVMQEQSSLLEKLRDLEDAKAAEDALQVVKIAGLEKIIETQKKELEVARGGNLASQPKSIQKTLEEQRGLLEEKDEQIRGLLAEGKGKKSEHNA